jgi:hypothetical protein
MHCYSIMRSHRRIAKISMYCARAHARLTASLHLTRCASALRVCYSHTSCSRTNVLACVVLVVAVRLLRSSAGRHRTQRHDRRQIARGGDNRTHAQARCCSNATRASECAHTHRGRHRRCAEEWSRLRRALDRGARGGTRRRFCTSIDACICIDTCSTCIITPPR